MKFTLTQKEIQYITRNIYITKELFNKINTIKGNVSLNKFVIEAIEYALNNIEED